MVHNGETITFTKTQHKLEKLYERFIILKKAVKSAAVSIYLIFLVFLPQYREYQKQILVLLWEESLSKFV